jgi:hypothetical protein
MYAMYSIAMDEEKRINDQLVTLEDQHRSLDEKISNSAANHLNMLEIQRLKKQKLFLKDQISKLKSTLLPDIMA